MPSTTPSTAISAHLAVRPDWLNSRREAALELRAVLKEIATADFVPSIER